MKNQRNTGVTCWTSARGFVLIFVSLAAGAFGLSFQAGTALAADQLVANSVTVGEYHTCAIRTSGQAVCWGSNFGGMLGDGTTTGRLTPTPVQGLSDAKSISVGQSHTCAIRISGQALCWGENFQGWLGDGTTTERLTPTPVQGLTDAKEISVARNHTCAIRESGEALCWGHNGDTDQGDQGKLGDGTTTDRYTPTPVQGLTDAKSISAGKLHTCAVRESGQALCWGSNTGGKLGDGTKVDKYVPTPVTGLDDATSIDANGFQSCAIRESGQAVCWGYNWYGALGMGALPEVHYLEEGDEWVNRESLTPVSVQGLSDAESISVGNFNHSCAMRESGQVVCWGFNQNGQFGTGTIDPGDRDQGLVGQPSPVNTLNLADATSLSTFESHTCAIRTSGQVVCWGANGGGQLADGTTTDRLTPTPVLDGPPVAPSQFSLTVNRSGTGTGTVTSTPAGINCGTDCSETYNEGTSVTLTATASSGSTFTGWSGACSGSGSCQVTMSEARSVTAAFSAKPPAVCPSGETGTPPNCVKPLAPGKLGKLTITKKAKVKAGKKVKVKVTVSNTGGKSLTVKVTLKSSNKQVKVPKSVKVTVAPGKSASKSVTVKAGKKAKGKAIITARSGGKSAKSKVTVK